MRVQAVELHKRSGEVRRYHEGAKTQDLHYIVREGLHIVNYVDGETGQRKGISLPVTDVEQVLTTC